MGVHQTVGSTLPDIRIVRKWFNELGYPDDLMCADWRMYASIMQPHSERTVHVMAFWDRPFDLFRSALAVDRTNGLPPADQARQLSDITNSHVLLCGNGQATLWIREWPDTVKDVGHVSTSGVSNLLNEHREDLERTKIAEKKIRLRQYALYETDPQGHRGGAWFIQPDIAKTKHVFSRIGIEVTRNCKDFNINHASWLYRILVLRVGLDREWKITQGLNQSAVSDFVVRGKQYPIPWNMRLSDAESERITETVLESLRDFTFSYIDPLFLLQALRIPVVKHLEQSMNLFPTPKSAAWDMIDSIPIHDEMIIYDPTVGTGTFLIAAAQSLWNRCGNRPDMMATLRRIVRGSDISPFALDLSHMSLDLAFGWEDAGWDLMRGSAERMACRISSKHEWVIVGNPPWDASGRSNNKASSILSAYIDALKEVPRCWLGTIVPRSVWTKRDRYGAKIRDAVADRFQVESICELPWGTIEGGKAQALAVLLSRGHPQTPTVWKRNDSRNAIHTIGYTIANPDSLLRSPDGRFLLQRLSDGQTIADFFNVRVGLQPRSVNTLPPADVGGIPFVLNVGEGSYSSIKRVHIEDHSWVMKHFTRPANDYRQELLCLPQIAMSGNIYEGSHRLQVYVQTEPRLFSNRFLVCTPRDVLPPDFAHGLKAILTSVLGKLWIHIFASAGRHIAKKDLEKFPLPPYRQVIRLGSGCSEDIRWKQHFAVCNAYGLTEEESAVIMALGHMIGIGSEVPRDVVQSLKPDEQAIERIRRQIADLDSDRDTANVLRLELKLIDEQDKARYMLLFGDDYQIALNKETL